MANYGYLHLDLKAIRFRLHRGRRGLGERRAGGTREQLCLFDLLAARSLCSGLEGRTEAANRGRTKEIYRAAQCSQVHSHRWKEKSENKREKPTEAAGTSV